MDGMMSDVLIVVDRGDNVFPVIGAVCGFDGVVHGYRRDDVLSCSVPSQHVHALREVPCVSYVRQVQSYLSRAA